MSNELMSHKMYKFSCGNGNITYHDKTEQYFNLKSDEHLDISHLTGKRVKYKPSAVSDHLLLHKHDRDFKDFHILC